MPRVDGHRIMQDSIKPNAHFEGTQHSGRAEKLQTESAGSEGTYPSEHVGKPQREGAFRRYATLEARGISANRTAIPSVRNPQRMREGFKPNVHSEGTQPSEHAGKHQSASEFQEYTTIGACGMALKSGRIPRVRNPRSMRDSL